MTEIATFAAGCFWGVEETFRTLPGIIKTRVGYIGGKIPNATYEQVCSGTTGHAEAVEIQYDQTKITYKALLDIFWENHDPTTLNRQGPDVGDQYRSAIFFHSDEQRTLAEKSRDELQNSPGFAKKKIVTEIVPAREFTEAEEYHQQYLAKRGKKVCH